MSPSTMALKTAQRYRGAVAEGYDARRNDKEKRKAEFRVLQDMLCDLPAGTSLLDIPFGTGFFVPIYEARGFRVTGLDINRDMLTQAMKLHRVKNVDTRIGDIFDIKVADKSFDVAVSIRIMNLIDADDMKRALGELQRVARSRIVFNLRVWHQATRYRRPHLRATIEDALQEGWHIARDDEIHEPDFRMFMLCAG